MLGPVGGEMQSDIVDGKFNPSDFFKDVLDEAKILGGISLADILGVVDDIIADSSAVPKLVTEKLPNELKYVGQRPFNYGQCLVVKPHALKALVHAREHLPQHGQKVLEAQLLHLLNHTT